MTYFSSKIVGWLVGASIVVSLTGCASTGPVAYHSGHNMPLSTKEILGSVKKPITPNELVRNIKYALDQDLFLQRDFYSHENLNLIFGAEQVTLNVSDTDQSHISADSINFGEIAKMEKFGQYALPGISFSGSVRSNTKGKATSGASFSIRSGGPDFYTLHDIFHLLSGSWTQDMSAPLHSPSPASTEPHGNERWRHVLETTSVKRTITIVLGRDGLLSHIYVEEEAR